VVYQFFELVIIHFFKSVIIQFFKLVIIHKFTYENVKTDILFLKNILKKMFAVFNYKLNWCNKTRLIDWLLLMRQICVAVMGVIC
jgi:hypothetical protein